MNRVQRGSAGVVLMIAVIAPVLLRAHTLELKLLNGRVSLNATDATAAQIFDAWSRAGGVSVVNADRLPSVPITIRLDDVPEEQALDTLLRSVSGYLARRRTTGEAGHSVFDRIVILTAPATGRDTAPPPPARAGVAPAPPPFPQPPALQRPATADVADAQQPAEPEGIPQGPGVVRLLGPDGQPMEDDQVGAPPPPSAPYGDSPPNAPPPPSMPPSRPPTTNSPGAPTSATPGAPTSAPVGTPAPGMVVPAPDRSGRGGAPGAPR